MDTNGLYAAARAGDACARAAVVEKLRPRLVSMAGHYARYSCIDEDDLLQEAWLGLLEALHEVDLAIGSPEQYLVQCARWRLLDAGRHARRRQSASLDDTSQGGVPWEETVVDGDPRAEPECAIGDAQVAEFVAGLGSLQRRIVLCLLHGMTWREAAAALGCTCANIAYHMRAIKHRYAQWCDEGEP